MKKSWFDTRQEQRNPVGIAKGLLKSFSLETCEDYMRPVLSDADFHDHVDRDQIPVPAPENREGYHGERHFCYWLSGLYDYKQILEQIPSVKQSGIIVDFGGASGRVARHFSLNHSGADIIVAELNINHIDYINDYFPGNTKALKLSSYPHFMLSDSSVDLLYAFSVFTHIDVYELSWIAEIYRILKSGSYAYLTIHSEHTWGLLPEAYLYETLKENREFKKLFRKGQPMPKERLVFEYNTGSNDYNCNVFHHSRYIEAHWGKWFNVEKVIFQGHGYQTVVILRKS
jgi:ubiquinone/menaquinone biosynthesis C-methylase UbiE